MKDIIYIPSTLLLVESLIDRRVTMPLLRNIGDAFTGAPIMIGNALRVGTVKDHFVRDDRLGLSLVWSEGITTSTLIGDK